jgi:TRAP-type mannitol/chloroaromatic compound transport system permease small subunit
MSDLEGFGFVMPHWFYWGWLAVMPLIMIALDRRKKRKLENDPHNHPYLGEVLADEDPVIHHHVKGNLLCRCIDWVSENSGIFISFWTVNAVCFYFFEVVMRYLFNMPTIWVHEASFLLLGMQYLLAGGFALLHGAHVRVDVLYNFLPERGRVGMDIFTSMFFFIFAIALVLTSWTFFQDAYVMGETTVETWGIQYWPVKGLMFVGSVLLLLAGVSKLLKDISLYIRMGRGEVL